ncbi:tartrate dehydrogenase [Leucobacter denitrificans]|uniref:D-malate dehydrogenase (decarboxylating) n=1 Tax=Leucobacter denitrificans TaxID=683042 RepID=A0A7G9S2A6_9MICO|nr:tartrate dehydrogenase [Leucobacter denitrificans]QNN61981.1 tartrate dehydrogenase [Leucobacter denitrificans]
MENSEIKQSYAIDVIAGDGIGQEVMPPAIACIDMLAAKHDFTITWRERDWSSERYLRDGTMMPANGIEQLADGDGIFLGAVGTPDIPDHITLWGLLIPIRRDFMQYINLRPTKLLPGLKPRVTGADSIDLLVVRENVEGEYSELGGRAYRGRPEELAIQEALFTRRGVERVARFALDLASRRSGRLVSATKSNGIIHSMPFWDEVIDEVGKEFSSVTIEPVLIDALAARGVLRPDTLDVVVASNLFGDILSDLLSAAAGSIGIAPSANLNPEHEFPSLFEPVHGSAPDIAGKGLANPIGQMWAGAMMLEHLGQKAAAAELTGAFESVVALGHSTPDLGGSLSTEEFTAAVIEQINTKH